MPRVGFEVRVRSRGRVRGRVRIVRSGFVQLHRD